ncbi:MAG: hypothetical protein DHS20C16_09520 [Phycisphaerae bacterium]|nr:MAG: hypothetical protein DHS20C16_09520 [Phycisphaerae bacterium]
MRRIAVINQKGGVGKTTSCCNVGAAIASTGRRVLMIDLDPQAHLSMHLGIDPYPDRPSVYDVLTDNLPVSEATIQLSENLHLIPAHIDLAAAEMELVSVMGREVILRDALPEFAEQYDVMMMDCPPSLGVLTINGLAAANEVLIPLQPHFLALQGVGKLLETIELVQKRINPELVVSGIILCMYEAGTRLAAEVTSDLKEFVEAARDTRKPWSKAKVFDTCIRRNIKLAESPGYGKTIFDYAHSSNGAMDYAMLAAEVLGIDQVNVPKQILTTPDSDATVDQEVANAPTHKTAPADVPTLEVEGRTVTGPIEVMAPEQETQQVAEPQVPRDDLRKPNEKATPTRTPPPTDRSANSGGGRIPIQFEEAVESDSEARLG